MSDEMQDNTIKLPMTGYSLDVIPTTSLDSMFKHEGADGLTTDIYSELFEQYLSNDTVEVMDKIRELEKSTLPTPENVYRKIVTLNEQLFDARANVKILLSQVSMHFSEELREKLFRQIDLMHDPDDWEVGDDPIQSQSFKTFLRWFYLIEPSKLPNFGLSDAGQIIASWLTNNNDDRLILEFLSNDRIKWFVTKYYDEEADHSSGLTKLYRVADVLAPYHSENWFTKEA